jgi:valyl-tRNA synthetase
MPLKLSHEIITAAIDGFESQKIRIDAQIQELRSLLSGGSAESDTATPEPKTGKRKKFSATARRRMKEAQQLRWAKIRGESEPSSPPATPEAAKPKRKMSAAGKKAISEASKKRWAAFHATAVKTAPVLAKKAATKKTAAKKAPMKVGKTSTPPKKSAAKKAALAAAMVEAST